MALLFMDGFDAEDYDRKWLVSHYGTNGTITTTTTTRFSSGRALEFIASGAAVTRGYYYVDKQVNVASTIFIGFAFNNLDSSILKHFCEIVGDPTSVVHLSLRQIDKTSIGLYRGDGTLLGSASYLNNTWQYIEISAAIADSGGTATVRIGGTEVISYSGDTRNGGDSPIVGGVRILAGVTDSYNGASCVFDDLYICDDTGTTNNTFLGDVRVQSLVPNAAGANTDFTPTGGTNYANVADIPDDTGTYNTSSTVGHKDTYDFSDLVSGTGTVFGIQTNMHAKKADAGLGALKEIVVAGSTTYDGNTTQLPTSTAWIGQIRETNPDTSAAWTVGDVNSLEAGAEVV